MFEHSIIVPRLYKRAAKIAQEVKEASGSLKDLVFKDKYFNAKALHAIVTETLRHISQIDFLLKRTQLLVKERWDDAWLARVLIAELLWGKKRLPGESKPVKTILAYQPILKAHCCDIPQNVLLGAKQVTIPRYVRVNTLLLQFKDAVEGFRNEGWTLVQHTDKNNYKEFLSKVSNLREKEFMIDMHIQDLLIFPPKTQFHRHYMYLSGRLVLQDKASCLPVQILSPPPNSIVLDMCAAPGIKTSHIAAMMKGEGKIYAVDRNSKRMQMLQNLMKSYQVTCVRAMNTDVLTATNLDCPDVEYILVDPSCSGSGLLDRPDCKSQIDQTDRMKKLTGFQIKILKHAFRKFPHAKRIVYSTCSLHPEENEAVVKEVLRSSSTYKLVSASDLLNAAWLNFGSEQYENIGKHCLYARPETDLTIGFFVAVFERLKDGEENQFFSNDYFAMMDCGAENHSLRPKNADRNIDKNKDYREKSNDKKNTTDIYKNENYGKKSQEQLSNVNKIVLRKTKKKQRRKPQSLVIKYNNIPLENNEQIGSDEKIKFSITSENIQKTFERRKSTAEPGKLHENGGEKSQEQLLNVCKNVLRETSKEKKQKKLQRLLSKYNNIAFEYDQEIGSDEKSHGVLQTSKNFQKKLERRKSTTESSKIHESYEEFVREIILGNKEEHKKKNSQNKLKTKYLKENRKNMNSENSESLTAENIKTEEGTAKNYTVFSGEEIEDNDYVKSNAAMSSSLLQKKENKVIEEMSDNENKLTMQTGRQKQKRTTFSHHTSDKMPENKNENFKKEEKSRRRDHSILENRSFNIIQPDTWIAKFNQYIEDNRESERNKKTEQECVGVDKVEVFINTKKSNRKNEQCETTNEEITNCIEIENIVTRKKIKKKERRSVDSHERNKGISKKEQNSNLDEAIKELIDTVYDEDGNKNYTEERNVSVKEIALGKTSRYKRNCSPKEGLLDCRINVKEETDCEDAGIFSSVKKSRKRRHTLSQGNNNYDTFSSHDHNQETNNKKRISLEDALQKLIDTVKDEDHNEDSSANTNTKRHNMNNYEEIDVKKGNEEEIIQDHETETSVDTKKIKKKRKHSSFQERYNEHMGSMEKVDMGSKGTDIDDFAITKEIKRKEIYIPSSFKDNHDEGSVGRKDIDTRKLDLILDKALEDLLDTVNKKGKKRKKHKSNLED